MRLFMLGYSSTFVDIIIIAFCLFVNVPWQSAATTAEDVVKCFIFWLVGGLRVCIMAFRGMFELLDMCDDQC
jgi:hypothetical protein